MVTETHSLAFRAGGTVRIANRQTIRFSLNMSLTAIYTEETHISLPAGDAVLKDPLVLTRVGTPLGLRDDHGNLQGQLRASSVYLTEAGHVGSVQQIDLVA